MKRAALLLLLCACSGVSPLVVTGESLAALGDTFAETATAMDAGLDAKTVTVEQYRAWRTFGLGFQHSYPLAVALWEVARATQDKATEREVARILVRLAGELAAFRVPPKAVP